MNAECPFPELPAKMLTLLNEAGFELTDPPEYDYARGPYGSIRMRAIGSGVHVWLQAYPDWESAAAVRQSLCCRACGEPIGGIGGVRIAERVGESRVEVFKYHDDCAPTSGATK